MQFTLLQSLLVSLFFSMCVGFIPFYFINVVGATSLVSGTIIGIILGKPLEGMLIGCEFQLAYMGVISVGTMAPVNPMIGCTIGTTIGLATGATPEAAVALAMPFTVLGSLYDPLRNTYGVFFGKKMEDCVANKDFKGMYVWHYVSFAIWFLIWTVFMFVMCTAGVNAAANILNSLPANVISALSTVGSVLPALGIALGLFASAREYKLVYFFAAYIISSNLGLGIIPLTLLSVCIAVIEAYIGIKGRGGDLNFDTKVEKKASLLEYKDVRKSLLTWMGQFNYARNYNKMSGDGFMVAMYPVIKKLYPNDLDKQAECLLNESSYFQTTPDLGTLPVGIAIAMEEAIAAGEDVSPEAIVNIKTGLMGPLAGIGDPLLQGVWGTLTGALGVGLAKDGNYVGFVITLIGALMPALLSLWLGKVGYYKGKDLVAKLFAGGYTEDIVNAASTIGCTAFGALAGQYVTFGITKLITFANVGDGTVIDIQANLDAILPGILPMALIIVLYKQLKAGKKVTSLLLALFIGAFVLGLLGILG